MCEKISISVKDIVTFIYTTGDLEPESMINKKLHEGVVNHVDIQSKYSDSSKHEVKIENSIKYKNYIFNIGGRIDGIHTKPNICIEEIKSTYKKPNDLSLKSNMAYYAQLCFYSYLYCIKYELDSISQQLLYFYVPNNKKIYFKETITKTALKEFVLNTLDQYIYWLVLKKTHKDKVYASLKKLNFPYANYRKGQYNMSKAIYLSINNNKNSFIQAPCGIGKTLGSIFPALKAISEDKCDRIIFSTSKNTQKLIAHETLNTIYDKDAYFRSIEITAKDKICFLEERNCSPQNCKYSKNYYGKLKSALNEILLSELHYTTNIIIEYAKKFEICPFEFTLNLCFFSELIICDYNYIYDPLVSLKSLFENNKERYVFLVDEAHNLPDRTSNMYTKSLFKQSFLNVKKTIMDDSSLKKDINRINRFFLKYKNLILNDELVVDELISEIIEYLEIFKLHASSYLEEHENKLLLDLLLEVVGFLKISAYYDDTFKTLFTIIKNNVEIKILNINPQKLIEFSMKKAISVNYFTATLIPVDYFKYMLNYTLDDIIINIPSFFSRNNTKVSIIGNISLDYKSRKKNLKKLVHTLLEIADKYGGNQIFFFPSHLFMEEVYNEFKQTNQYNTILQKRNLSNDERIDFLNKFICNPKDSNIGFCVLGGVFSEGIDLKGSRLSTCVIVSISLPQVCTERNLIRNHFQKKGYNGFDYAYTFNSITRILQASGRLIRSDRDSGNIILIGKRFLTGKYISSLKNTYKYIDDIK